MNIIQIKRCTFVESSQSRTEFVKRICDIFINGLGRNLAITLEMRNDFQEFFIDIDSTGEPRLSLYGRKENKIRTCEMRLAFRVLQNAGYHIFYKEQTETYIVTEREYMRTQRATYTDFIHHID